jgi:hypothetical protein
MATFTPAALKEAVNESDVIKLERYVQPKVIDALNKSHVLELERMIQNKIIPLLGGSKVFAQTRAVQSRVETTLNPPPAPSSSATPDAPITVYQPVEVNGFFKVTGDTEVTFFVTTPWPGFAVGPGWTGTGFYGIVGNIHITSASNTPGSEPVTSRTSEIYNWKFTLQSDTEQFIEGTRHAIGPQLYPPDQVPRATAQRSGPIYGNFTVDLHVPKVILTAPPPEGLAVGWYIFGLPTVGPCKIVSYDGQTLMLEPNDGSIPENTPVPIFLRGSPTMAVEPKYSTDFVAARFYTSDLEKRKPVDINPRVMGGKTYVPLRDLSTELRDDEPHYDPFLDIKGKGFSTGSVLSLFATGPQDKYLLTDDPEKSAFRNTFKQHTNFVMYQRVTPFPPGIPSYQGQTYTIELSPTEVGHLISNMYFTCTIPASNYLLNENIGRALIKQVDLMVNETVVETLYDDWYIIRDQEFLDADEQLGMYNLVGGYNSNISATSNVNVVCPLEFFFCRRHSHANKGRERLRKPYFPMCAMWNQKLYIRFTFHPSAWWSNSASTFDFTNPALLTEEILLDYAEKLYYQNTHLKYIVNRVKKETPVAFGASGVSGIFSASTAQIAQTTVNQTSIQLSASFPVQSIFWFFRSRSYESVTSSNVLTAGQPDGSYYNQRYNYGYTSDYIRTGVTVAWPSSNNTPTNFIDPISTAKITLNNIDILSTFQGSLYYAYKQPMEHGLSVPSRNIYTYSFGLTPAEYNQGGFLNFSKLNSQTTSLTLAFNPTYATQISQGYNLYLFYYGYSVLEFHTGFARLAFS